MPRVTDEGESASMTDQIRNAKAHPQRFETMRWRSAFH